MPPFSHHAPNPLDLHVRTWVGVSARKSATERRRQRPAAVATVVAFLLLGLAATEAFGCPTCKDGLIASDDASANIARGYFYSILLMLAMPFTLASCFGMYVWREYRRQQRAGVFDHITDPGVRPPSYGGPRGGSPARSPGVAAGSHAS